MAFSSESFSRGINRLLSGSTEIRPGEGREVLGAGLLFFVLLTVIMILRPLREALGLAQGIEKVRGLFLITLGSTLLLAPLFGWLVSRVRRDKLLTVSFRICAVILLGFCAGLTLFPASIRMHVASVYYVYHSVFNLFVVSLFWAFMADLFSLTESKRLFPAIAIGGTLGAIFGSLISWDLSDRLGVASLFIVAVALLEVAVWLAAMIAHRRSRCAADLPDRRPIGGHSLAGITAVARSPYILGIGMFIVIAGVVSTFLYFTGLRLVAAASNSLDHRTSLFANINIWRQVVTLLVQAFLAARIIRWAGVGVTLSMLPILAVGGTAGLMVWPTLNMFTLVNAFFRAAQQGIARPARETLFTVVEREEKYKAKSFLDTFGFRSGDACGAQIERSLANLGPGLIPMASAVFLLATIWISLAIALGRTQTRRANASGDPPAVQVEK